MSEYRRHIAKAIDNAIPKGIMKSMVCWYSPKRQGCTNENMRENPVLKDLSGNGRHLYLHEFAWNNESGIDEGGRLVFDGEKDYGETNPLPRLEDFTLIFDAEYPVVENNNSFISTSDNKFFSTGSRKTTGVPFSCVIKGEIPRLLYYLSPAKNGQFIISPNYYYDSVHKIDGIESGTFCIENDETTLWVGKDTSAAKRMAAKMKYILLFDRTLTEEEIEWVKLNLID